MKYKRLFLIAALSLLMIFALFKLGRVEFSLDTLRRIHWGWYSLVIASFYAGVLARGWRWRSILKAMGYPVGLVYALTLLVAGLFLSAILPARAGDISRVAMLKQDHHIPVAKGIASIATERVLDVFSILMLAVLGAWLALAGRIPPEVLKLMLAVGVLLVFGMLGLLVIPGIEIWLREAWLIKRIVPVRLWPAYAKILDFGFSLIAGVRILGQKPAALAGIVAQSFFIWLWDGLIIYFILISLGLAEPFSVSLFSAMMGALATAVPLTPGALGQYDAALISLLGLFNVSAANGSLTVLLLRLVQLWTFIPVAGLITYIFGFARALNLNPAEIESQPAGALPASRPAES
jgi:hypothetical protein